MIMEITIRPYRNEDVAGMVHIWNEVIDEGIAFPQEDFLTEETGRAFFAEQSHCAVATCNNSTKIYGMYILHPNNVGRCGHIGNASFAVSAESRGLHIGEKLVKDCIAQGRQRGFKLLQFNAVVASNTHARHLYERLGFEL